MDKKVRVSEHALMQRINRKLAHTNEQVRKVTPGMRHEVMFSAADFYVLNMDRNCIDQAFGDLEGTARDLGVLRPWEELAGSRLPAVQPEATGKKSDRPKRSTDVDASGKPVRRVRKGQGR